VEPPERLASPPEAELLAGPLAQTDPQQGLVSVPPVRQAAPWSQREGAKAAGQRLVSPVQQA